MSVNVKSLGKPELVYEHYLAGLALAVLPGEAIKAEGQSGDGLKNLQAGQPQLNP